MRNVRPGDRGPRYRYVAAISLPLPGSPSGLPYQLLELGIGDRRMSTQTVFKAEAVAALENCKRRVIGLCDPTVCKKLRHTETHYIRCSIMNRRLRDGYVAPGYAKAIA